MTDLKEFSNQHLLDQVYLLSMKYALAKFTDEDTKKYSSSLKLIEQELLRRLEGKGESKT